jgi:hypothetical protein
MSAVFKTIHQVTPLRDALPDDEVEVQAANGGASARAPVASLAGVGPAGPTGAAGSDATVTKAAVLAAIGLTTLTVTDTNILIEFLGSDAVTRRQNIPLE